MQSHPQKLQLRLHHNPARLAVFRRGAGGAIYRAWARALLYLSRLQVLVCFSITFPPSPQIALLSGFCQRLLASAESPGEIYTSARRRQDHKTLSNSREAMRAPLHPRLTSDPPPVIEISTGDFTIRDHESHATSSAFNRDPLESCSHTQSGAGQRVRAGATVPARAKGAILPWPRLCALSIPVKRHLDPLDSCPLPFGRKPYSHRAAHL